MTKKDNSMAQKNAKNDPSEKHLSWKDLPIGGVIPTAGNSTKYHTGVWSPTKIQYIPKNCTQCGMCFSACPDSAIIHDENGKMIGVDTDHCKACGLCVEACKFSALEIQRKNK